MNSNFVYEKLTQKIIFVLAQIFKTIPSIILHE